MQFGLEDDLPPFQIAVNEFQNFATIVDAELKFFVTVLAKHPRMSATSSVACRPSSTVSSAELFALRQD